MNGVVVLLSGGLDSAVCAALAPGATALHVDYGQPHAVPERYAAERLAAHYALPLEQVQLPRLWNLDRDDPLMSVPGRNLLLLGLAAQLTGHGGTVVFGANRDDARDYPDCQLPFLSAAARAAGVVLSVPLIDMNKRAVGRTAMSAGVPVELTWSCYYPLTTGEACGECNACLGRARAEASMGERIT